MKIKSIITAAMALLASTACSGGAKQEKVMKTEGKAIVVQDAQERERIRALLNQ